MIQCTSEFPSRKWNKHALYRLIKQIDATGMLGWDQSGTCGLSHRSVVTTCECSYSGTWWTHWTFVRLILYSIKTFIVRAIRFLKLFRPNAKSWHLEFQTFIFHGISLKMTHRWLMAFSQIFVKISFRYLAES